MTDQIGSWALVESGRVVNVCLWDGDRASWSPPAGVEAVRLEDGQACGIGWLYDGTRFVDPAGMED